MKKRLLLFTLCCYLLSGNAVQAEEAAGNSPPAWEISVQPKPTAKEIEQDRWSYVFANDIAIYAFDHQSLKLDEEDKKVVHVLTKTIFTDMKVIGNLNEKYKEKLSPGDKVAYCEMQMVFQLKKKTYAVTETRVYSAQGTVLEDHQQSEKFVPVPSKTFADSMYDIARNFEKNN